MPAKRKYELKRRAENQATTRQRIVEAALQLHATVGPARTTVMDIAKGAGVERVTVYRHFPDDLALFTACSAHYRAQNAPPETSSWAAIDDPIERLRLALRALYAYYDQVAPMLQTYCVTQRLCPPCGGQPNRADATSPNFEISWPAAGRFAGGSVSTS